MTRSTSSWSSFCFELLEHRRLLSAAAPGAGAGAGAGDAMRELRARGDADVSVHASATSARDWRSSGALDRRALPVGATVEAVAGWTYQFSRATFETSLPTGAGTPAREILLPTPSGTFARFAVRETALLAPDVAAANGTVRTFRGVGIDDPRAVVHFDLTFNGLHATVLSPSGQWAVSPVTEYAPDLRAGAAGGAYASYFLAHVPVLADALACEVHDHDGHDDELLAGGPDVPTGPTHFQMRLAVAANGEWTLEAGGTQASAFATIVSAVNVADLRYREEFSIGFTLVSGTELVYTDPNTDPYTNSNASTMLTQNQQNIDALVGDANYDIGHVFTRSGGGVAFLGVVGEPGWKARGVSGNSPTTSAYQMTFWHEMGHQFGASHTWNHSNAQYSPQRSAHSAYEPGPGSTNMSYGGFSFFPGNFVPVRDPYFHARSHEQVSDYVVNDAWGALAGTRTPTGNDAPVVDAGPDRTIPARTPFELVGAASDATGPLAFVWEQYDLGDEDPIGIDDGNGPLFRSRPPVASPRRLFPELSDILANRSDPDETLPQVARIVDPLTFRLTARDGAGGVHFDAVDLVVIDTGAPFAISSNNAPGAVWTAGSEQTITWDVAGTSAAPIGAATVTIYLSLDNGQTLAPVLAGAPNTGSATILVPHATPLTNLARVMVKADGNVFFDINNAPIRIEPDTTLDVHSVYFDFETRHAIGLRFNEPIDLASLSVEDVIVESLTGGTTLPASHFQLTPVPGSDNREFRWTSSAPGGATILPDADYRATIPAGAVADLAGNTLASDLMLDFFFLNGDANRDGRVNLDDFNILAANFGQSNRTFTQGDFTYDGQVNLDDFNVLAGRFGMALPPTNLPARGADATGDDAADEDNEGSAVGALLG